MFCSTYCQMDLFDYNKRQLKKTRFVILVIFTSFIIDIIEFVSSSPTTTTAATTTTTLAMPTLIMKMINHTTSSNDECENDDQCKQLDQYKLCDRSTRQCYCNNNYYENPFNNSCQEKYRHLPTYKKQERKYFNKYRTNNNNRRNGAAVSNFRRDLLQYTLYGCFVIGQIVLTSHYLIQKRMKVLRRQIELEKQQQQQQQQQQEQNETTDERDTKTSDDDVIVEIC
ncbi:hypothetical protein DERF_011156 [Dermatophagoides farinae]|uniref:Uncharacterized protein n=1 Tax=Dermatophagoides farinae TaxID=6954 RepID=A0A922L018_DERFA|nr:hypothetical protein DERF_011156 [Dermatophagoides farinae]